MTVALLAEAIDRPRLPMKGDVIVDTKLIPCKPVLNSWLPVEITHVETPIRFYMRYTYGPSWNLGMGKNRECIGLRR